MPSIPRLSQSQVRSSAGPIVQQEQLSVTPVDVQKIGTAAMQVFAKEYDTFNKSRALEATNKLAEAEQAFSLEMEQAKQRNAAEKLPEIQERYRKTVAELTGSLSNDSQKNIFREQADRSAITFNGSINRYAAQQGQEYVKSTAANTMKLSQQQIGVNPFDEDTYSASVAKQQESLVMIAQSEGWSKEEMLVKNNDILGQSALVRINALSATKDFKTTRAFYDSVKDQLPTEYRDKADLIVKQSVLMGEAQEMSDELFSSNRGLGAGLAEIRAKTEDNPELRAQATSMFKGLYADRELIRSESARARNIEVANLIDGGTRFKDIAPAKLSNLSTSERNALRSYAEDRQKGIQPVTDWTKWTRLTQMAADPERRAEFNQMDPVAFRPYLADSQYQEIVKLQTEMRSGKSPKELDGVRSDNQVIDQTAQAMGIRNDPKSTSASKKYNAYRQAVETERNRFINENKRAPKTEELQFIVDKLLLPENTSWYQPSRNQFEADRTEEFSVQADTIADVPQSFIKQIRESNAFRSLPKERQNNGNVLRIYNQIAGQRGK